MMKNLPATFCRVVRCNVMVRTKCFLLDGRLLEVRERRVLSSFQVWIYEGGQPVSLYSTLRLGEIAAAHTKGIDLLNRAMSDAIADVLQGRHPLLQAAGLVAAE